ncbi:MAG: hypothetical protein WDM79_13395 [Terricaulis sp.]
MNIAAALTIWGGSPASASAKHGDRFDAEMRREPHASGLALRGGIRQRRRGRLLSVAVEQQSGVAARQRHFEIVLERHLLEAQRIGRKRPIPVAQNGLRLGRPLKCQRYTQSGPSGLFDASTSPYGPPQRPPERQQRRTLQPDRFAKYGDRLAARIGEHLRGSRWLNAGKMRDFVHQPLVEAVLGVG